ncbi:MAG: hypothetical protein H7Z43_08245 [Clostridia bacterium]|nr:hypothetical protein [Deltaproteobacteria bacterium]
MRFLVAMFAVAVVTPGCEKAPEGSEAAQLETFTARDVKPQSREQIKFYAQTEGHVRPSEDAVNGYAERVRAGYAPTVEKTAALAALKLAISNARPLINHLKTSGVSEWEALKPGIDAALAEVDKRRAAFDAIP